MIPIPLNMSCTAILTGWILAWFSLAIPFTLGEIGIILVALPLVLPLVYSPFLGEIGIILVALPLVLPVVCSPFSGEIGIILAAPPVA